MHPVSQPRQSTGGCPRVFVTTGEGFAGIEAIDRRGGSGGREWETPRRTLGAAADCLQPPLRCGFRQRLSASVRLKFHRSGKEVCPG